MTPPNGQWVQEKRVCYTRCNSPLCSQYTWWVTEDGQPPAGVEPQCGCCYARLPAWEIVQAADIPKGVIMCLGKITQGGG